MTDGLKENPTQEQQNRSEELQKKRKTEQLEETGQREDYTMNSGIKVPE